MYLIEPTLVIDWQDDLVHKIATTSFVDPYGLFVGLNDHQNI